MEMYEALNLSQKDNFQDLVFLIITEDLQKI